MGVATREPVFWGIFAVYFFTSTAMFAIIVQVVAYLVAVGFPPLDAATAWGFSGMLLPVGMVLVGWLDAIIGRRPSVLLSYALSLLGIGALWLLARFPNVWLLGVFVVCFGGMLGSRGPLLATITPACVSWSSGGDHLWNDDRRGRAWRCARSMGRRRAARLDRELRAGNRLCRRKCGLRDRSVLRLPGPQVGASRQLWHAGRS